MLCNCLVPNGFDAGNKICVLFKNCLVHAFKTRTGPDILIPISKGVDRSRIRPRY